MNKNSLGGCCSALGDNCPTHGKDKRRRELTERVELAILVDKDDSFMEFRPSHVQILIDDAKDLSQEIRNLKEILKEADRIYSTYGLLAQSSDCGKWINSVRKAISP